MIKPNKYSLILIVVTLVFSIFTSVAFAQSSGETVGPNEACPDGYIKIGAPAPGEPNCLPKETAFSDYVGMIYNLAITLSVILATIMVIYGGYRYMTSSGNPETLAEAKDIITGAIVGLILLVLAALVLRTISPDIVGTS